MDFDDSLTHGIAWTIPNDSLHPPPFRDLVAENDNFFTCFFGPACVSISYGFMLRRDLFCYVAKVYACGFRRVLTRAPHDARIWTMVHAKNHEKNSAFVKILVTTRA